MKRFVSIIFVLLTLSGCSFSASTSAIEDAYQSGFDDGFIEGKEAGVNMVKSEPQEYLESDLTKAYSAGFSAGREDADETIREDVYRLLDIMNGWENRLEEYEAELYEYGSDMLDTPGGYRSFTTDPDYDIFHKIRQKY